MLAPIKRAVSITAPVKKKKERVSVQESSSSSFYSNLIENYELERPYLSC